MYFLPMLYLFINHINYLYFRYKSEVQVVNFSANVEDFGILILTTSKY